MQDWQSWSKVRSVERDDGSRSFVKREKRGGKQDWLSWSQVRSVEKRYSADEDRAW
jgi:hypothetical protein